MDLCELCENRRAQARTREGLHVCLTCKGKESAVDLFPWHELDKILDPLTGYDVITMAVCNERDPANPEVVDRIFKDLLYSRTRDAREMFREHKADIIKEIKERTREG